MNETPQLDPDLLDTIVEQLRDASAVLAFVHGSRAQGRHRPESDTDVAAWFGRDVDRFELETHLPAGVDLLVLDDAPLELTGRVAMHGRLLFETDPAQRVEWQATTRKIYLDERPRVERSRADYAASAAMVDTEGLATPETNAEALLELGRRELLDKETAERTARAVGFRNVPVHRYAEVRDERVLEQLAHLEALSEFVRALGRSYL